MSTLRRPAQPGCRCACVCKSKLLRGLHRHRTLMRYRKGGGGCGVGSGGCAVESRNQVNALRGVGMVRRGEIGMRMGNSAPSSKMMRVNENSVREHEVHEHKQQCGAQYSRYLRIHGAKLRELHDIRKRGLIAHVAGMMRENLLPQTRAVDMEVDFGCGYGFVAEHLLYGAQVGAPFEQMGGEAVTQRVG